VDLDKRVHRNQDTRSLGKMAFVIKETFLTRLEKLGRIELKKELLLQMIQYNLVGNNYEADILDWKALERPPMIDIPEYREKFRLS